MKQKIKLSFFLFFFYLQTLSAAVYAELSAPKVDAQSLIWFDHKMRITTFVYMWRVYHKLTFTPSGCSSFINKMLTHCQKYKRHPVLMVFDSFIIHQFVSEYKIYNNKIWSEFCHMRRRLGNNSVLYKNLRLDVRLARTYVPCTILAEK